MWTELLWLGNGCGDEPSGCIKEVTEQLSDCNFWGRFGCVFLVGMFKRGDRLCGLVVSVSGYR